MWDVVSVTHRPDRGEISVYAYLNGEFPLDTEARVSVFDGGYLYGDGVYTTLRVYHGRALDLGAHWERLVQQATALAIPVPLALPQIQGITSKLIELNKLSGHDGRLRITISRGGSPSNPLPLHDLEKIPPSILATLCQVNPQIETWQKTGIKAVVLGPAYARSHFPELKSLNSLTTVLALRQAARTGCQEAILTAPGGRILEGAISNLFLVNQGRLLTPAVSGGFLPGLTRQRVLGLCQKLGISFSQQTLTTEDLTSAQEVFCVSSVREILPVVTIDQKPVHKGQPGTLTQQLQTAYKASME